MHIRSLTTVVECGQLPDPPNGRVMLNGMVFESEAMYNCSTGYNLFGDAVRSCGPDGEWLGNQPTCEGDEGLYYTSVYLQRSSLCH